MEFMTFEDLTGIYETTFFPESYRRNGPLLNRRQPFWIQGKVESDHGGIMLNAEKVESLA
jgi:DNA polymerase-3 subunit alpha/error-prone DNA polymerase